MNYKWVEADIVGYYDRSGEWQDVTDGAPVPDNDVVADSDKAVIQVTDHYGNHDYFTVYPEGEWYGDSDTWAAVGNADEAGSI